MNLKTEREFIAWLKGYLEGKIQLDTDEIENIQTELKKIQNVHIITYTHSVPKE